MRSEELKNTTGNRPYKRECLKCHKWFCSADDRAKYHAKCNPKRLWKAVKYPRLFYYRRAYIMQRDNNFCQLCGAFPQSANEWSYHVHHIDRNIYNNDWQNLITLCPSCHIGWHASKRSGKKVIEIVAKRIKIDEKQDYVAPPKKTKFLFKGI